MKKTGLRVWMMTMLLAVLLSAGAQAASAKKTALAQYKAFLESKSNEDYVQFALIYLDKNSVPELVYGSKIYTCKNGEMTLLDDFYRMQPTSYYKKTGVIELFYAHASIMYGSPHTYSYQKLEKGKFESKLAKYREQDLKGKIGWSYWDGSTKVSKKAFSRALKKLTKSRKATKIKYYKNTAANRKKRVK